MDPQSRTLKPLPSVLRHGLTAVSFFGFLSFLTTTTLLLVLTYRLVSWYCSPSSVTPHPNQDERNSGAAIAEEMGLPDTVYGGGRREKKTKAKKNVPNQFLVLIYNLLLADIQQSLAFLLNAAWLTRDGIIVETSTCWAQGWFISTGDLASSAFITTIAVHTYLSVVREYKLPTWAFYCMIFSAWVLVYALAVAGVLVTHKGAEPGGLYVRAAAWCWISKEFEALRLFLHYLWMFVAFFVTAVLYTLIFIHIRRTDPSLQLPSSSSASKTSRGRGSSHARAASLSSRPMSPSQQAPASTPSNAGHHPAFLIYPIIYILCTAPLALGRVLTMAGRQVSLEYFCIAGAMIASNGWLDVLLFSTTRHVIIFNASPGYEETGLETFAFMRTPANRRFGNMVWVQGGGSKPSHVAGGDEGTGGWLWKLFRRGSRGAEGRPGVKPDGHRRCGAHRSTSQESLRRRGGMEGIQMETVTTVVVEVDGRPGGLKLNGRSGSTESLEKLPAQSIASL